MKENFVSTNRANGYLMAMLDLLDIMEETGTVNRELFTEISSRLNHSYEMHKLTGFQVDKELQDSL